MSTLTLVRSQSIHTPVLTPMLTVLAFINILKNGIRYGNIRWLTTVTSKAKRSRQKQNARVKSKTLASKAKQSHQKQIILASKAKQSRQKQNHGVKSKTVASKAKQSRQKRKNRVKSQTLASKAKQSRQKQNTSEL